ncbi:hypothetical protein GobsT_65060 [Gemmata obscuriglobus]|nr:hypothetical protein [Gemmata obscuriglobus]QEG31662.1 hypothetical protein GobsT_65060 [Gemmata obscuriglobus]VTS11008.1 Uncharacterized protein OS=Tolypothrix bouteillei VB521301 GN=DA73_21895 PE=4 SV=1 [Gemmata obscuriglobus UQM 2246]
MWEVRQLEFRPVELDFRSAGLGSHASTALYADGHHLINALDLVIPADPVQVQVCGQCGQVGCVSGGWVSPRRFGDALVLVPCFREMANELDSSSRTSAQGAVFEYGPPECIQSNGPALFRDESLRVLGSQVPAFRDVTRWPVLSARELVRLIQWYAPTRVLGEFPAPPRVRSEFVVAVAPGEKDETLTRLDGLLSRAFASEAPAEAASGQPVSFFLDMPRFPDWSPLVLDGTIPRLVFPALQQLD